MLAAITTFDIVAFVVLFLMFCGFLLPLSILPARLAAAKARIPTSNLELIGMLMRRSNPKAMVQTTSLLRELGYSGVTLREVETIKLSGVNMPALLAGVTTAKRNGVNLPLDAAHAICLAGRDLKLEVRKFIEANPAKEVSMSAASVLSKPR
ncbi:MAG: flotillin-like FloA family protein [Phycisphaerae bacterium]|jgi:uncharacterized protein YqfA (UPF0365 family)